MNISVEDFICKAELNDFRVSQIDLDVQKNTFYIYFKGAYLFDDGGEECKVFDRGVGIKISSFTSFEGRYFLPTEKLWYNLNYKELEMLDEINEKSFFNNILRLAGSGQNGYWFEYLIEGGIIDIIINE